MSGVTFGELTTRWMKSKKGKVATNTLKNYGAALNHLVNSPVGMKPVEEVTTAELETVITEEKEFSARTEGLLITLTKAVLKFGREMGLDVPMLTLTVKDVKTSRTALTADERSLFITLVQEEYTGYAFLFQLFTGIRPGELIALQWADVDFDTQKMNICHTASRQDGKLVLTPTKNKKILSRHLNADCIQILEHQRALQKHWKEKCCKWNGYDYDFVFTTKKGTPLDLAFLNRVLRRIEDKMRITLAKEKHLSKDEVTVTHITAHVLRHTFATMCMEQDIPLQIVSKWLGHGDIRTTANVYSHVLEAEEKRRAESLSIGCSEEKSAL